MRRMVMLPVRLKRTRRPRARFMRRRQNRVSQQMKMIRLMTVQFLWLRLRSLCRHTLCAKAKRMRVHFTTTTMTTKNLHDKLNCDELYDTPGHSMVDYYSIRIAE